jgi:transcriptional regulator with XRE-family HTH domain
MKKQPSVIFASRLRALSASHGATQMVLSKAFGVSQASVSKWFNGSVPKPDLLPKIAAYFNVSVDHLLGQLAEGSAGLAPPSPVVREPNPEWKSAKENGSISELVAELERALEHVESAVRDLRAAAKRLSNGNDERRGP